MGLIIFLGEVIHFATYPASLFESAEKSHRKFKFIWFTNPWISLIDTHLKKYGFGCLPRLLASDSYLFFIEGIDTPLKTAFQQREGSKASNCKRSEPLTCYQLGAADSSDAVVTK